MTLHRNEFRSPSATRPKRQLPPDRRDVCVPGSWCERVQTTRSCRSPLLKDRQRRPSYEPRRGQNSQSGCCREGGLDFRWRHAHLRKGLSGGDRSCHQRQGSDHECLDHGSDKHESSEHGAVLWFSTKISSLARQTQCCECQRNFCNASVVSFGCSSSTQCPAFFSTTTVASVATSLACCPSASPNDLSPPMVNTGMVNLV